MNSIEWGNLTYFSENELRPDGTRAFSKPEKMSLDLMDKLDRARHISREPFIINSSFREDDDKTHGRGEGVDIACTSSRKRDKMLYALRKVGFTRIGIYDIHLHADVGKAKDGFPQNVTWWGKSK